MEARWLRFMKLTALQCQKASPKDKAYKLTDGAGLYLEVMPTGAKYWRLQYHYAGKRPRISLGVYPEVSLSDAREKRFECRQMLKKGFNPGEERNRQKLHTKIAQINTFELLAREWHQTKLEGWTPDHAAGVFHRLEQDVFPFIGSMPIDTVTAPDVIATIRKIEDRGANELARRALQNVGRIFRYAMVTGRAERDPTYKMAEALRPQSKGHYASIDASELPKFLNALRANAAHMLPTTKMAMEILMLTFVRTGELIGATWEEFDLEAKIWVIPARRMKMNRDHLVPLSDQVVAKLNLLKSQAPGYSSYVFRQTRKPREPISNVTILRAIERLGYKGRMTGHGFRALAMSTIKEKLGYRHEVIDRQLAHVPYSKVTRAYDRAEFLDDRRRMMQDWANYIDGIAKQE